jgi:hypothetical protein
MAITIDKWTRINVVPPQEPTVETLSSQERLPQTICEVNQSSKLAWHNLLDTKGNEWLITNQQNHKQMRNGDM